MLVSKRVVSLLFWGAFGLFFMSADATQCGSPPPCADEPMSIMGYFNGVLYSEDLVGQTYAYVEEICLNVGGDPLYFTSTDDFQTYVMLEEIEGYEVYVISIGNFKYPWEWDGGVQILVFYDAAYASAHTGNPVPLDGTGAIAYYWETGYWDMNVQPQYVTDSGEIVFDVVSRVPGGFVNADYSGHLVPYVSPDSPSRLAPFRGLELAPEW